MFELMVDPAPESTASGVQVTWRKVHLDVQEESLAWSAVQPLSYR
jgi:hypothetical protein